MQCGYCGKKARVGFVTSVTETARISLKNAGKYVNSRLFKRLPWSFNMNRNCKAQLGARP
jgi:hypothetical protein